jgi:chromosome segregation ATPase
MRADEHEARLVAAHDKAKAELVSAENKASNAEAAVAEVKRELHHQQKMMRAFSGDEPELLADLLDSVEMADLDVAKIHAEINRLIAELRDRKAELKAANDALDIARKSESSSFYGLQQLRHKSAVLDALRLEVSLGDALRRERVVRNDVAGREGVMVGSLPVFAHPHSAFFAVKDGQSGVNQRLREAAKFGWIDGNEEWLKGVEFNNAALSSVNHFCET